MPDGLALRVRVTPKSSRDAVQGTRRTADGTAVQVHVRAAPSAGEANTATATAVAAWLGLPRGRVAVSSGHKSRVKMLLIGGSPEELETLVRSRIAAFE